VRPTLLALLMTTASLAAPPKAGERHPDFTLPDIETGRAKSLSDFRGKKVLLVQFASW
jgi:peroxiredoxin